jgi:hypothetical protein
MIGQEMGMSHAVGPKRVLTDGRKAQRAKGKVDDVFFSLLVVRDPVVLE